VKRRDLSDSELSTVIKHRQDSMSWLAIEKETGMPRRTIKRAYDEWESEQSQKKPDEPRVEDVWELRRKHIDSLIRIAEVLIENISIPDSPSIDMLAKDRLDRIWSNDILQQLPIDKLANNDDRNARIQSMTHSFKLLFHSLKTHTKGKVDWYPLSQWSYAWDLCIADLHNLDAQSEKQLNDFFGQTQNLLQDIKRDSGNKNAIKTIVANLRRILWSRITHQQLDSWSPVVQIVALKDRKQGVVWYGRPSDVILRFKEARLAYKTSDIINKVAKNLCLERYLNIIGQLTTEVGIIQGAIEKLSASLSSDVLRPIIEQSRCELCPV
jgi:hypothetical protein